ncbi:c-type cytochrome [Bhargavaea ullalensis]|uniref:Thiosulfate dehydrogenase n=1 Tax=Bhargavaea ullalensis TaxID=1265685 RepID=A0ABV2GBR6_9BACL
MQRTTGITLIFLLVVSLATIGFLGIRLGQDKQEADGSAETSGDQEETAGESGVKSASFQPPSMDDLPEGPHGEVIQHGYDLVNMTSTELRKEAASAEEGEAKVNGLSCASCHAGAGLEKSSMSLVGTTVTYPRYNERADAVMTIEDRINGCMVRSMNGEEFETGDEDLQAIVAYMAYISEGMPEGGELEWKKPVAMKDVPVPDADAGEELFKQSCIACHAADGGGTGEISGPALWGSESFNDGAGLSRHDKMAGFIHDFMPKTDPGSLTEQEASDLAAFILMQDRPEWGGKDKDWPKGGRPNDLIDKEKREQLKNGEVSWEEVVKKEK